MPIIFPPTTNQTDLPPVPDGIDAGLSDLLNRMRESLQVLRANRGDPLDSAITWRGLIANGLAQMTFIGLGGSGGSIIPPSDPGQEPDLTPPPTVTGLAVFAGISKILVQWDAATYTQGHGNRQTNIYAVQRDPADTSPDPTFTDAVLVSSGTQPLTIIDISSNPNTKWFVWAKYESVDGVESVAPAGGTNGVQATTGQDVTDLLDSLNQAALDPNSPYVKVSFRADLFFIAPTADFYQDTTPTPTAIGDLWFQPSTGDTFSWDGTTWNAFPVELPFFVTTVPIVNNGVTSPPGVYIRDAYIANGTITNAMIGTAVIDDAKISDLSASKITAGAIDVGAYIESPNYVSGSAGWRISGSGVAEFESAIVRGTLYAGAGTIGGATIGTDFVQSSAYIAGSTGWRLDNTTGKLYAASALLHNAGGTRIFDMDATGTDPVLQIDSAILIDASGNATFGGTITGANVVDTSQLVADCATAIHVGTGSDQTFSTAGPNDCASVVITTTGAKVLAQAYVGFSYEVASSAAGATGTVEFRLLRDGSQVWTSGALPVQNTYTDNIGGIHLFMVSTISPIFLDSGPSAAAHTYKLQVVTTYSGGGAATLKVFSPVVTATEIKR